MQDKSLLIKKINENPLLQHFLQGMLGKPKGAITSVDLDNAMKGPAPHLVLQNILLTLEAEAQKDEMIRQQMQDLTDEQKDKPWMKEHPEVQELAKKVLLHTAIPLAKNEEKNQNALGKESSLIKDVKELFEQSKNGLIDLKTQNKDQKSELPEKSQGWLKKGLQLAMTRMGSGKKRDRDEDLEDENQSQESNKTPRR